jgi:hypothetical protein
MPGTVRSVLEGLPLSAVRIACGLGGAVDPLTFALAPVVLIAAALFAD